MRYLNNFQFSDWYSQLLIKGGHFCFDVIYIEITLYFYDSTKIDELFWGFSNCYLFGFFLCSHLTCLYLFCKILKPRSNFLSDLILIPSCFVFVCFWSIQAHSWSKMHSQRCTARTWPWMYIFASAKSSGLMSSQDSSQKCRNKPQTILHTICRSVHCLSIKRNK